MLRMRSQIKSQLEQLRQVTTVVADTGDIEAIKQYHPEDATTNPSLIFKAASIEGYASLITSARGYAKKHSDNKQLQVAIACDMLAVNIGKEILKTTPGRVSTEVDARLSYDTSASLAKARQLIKMYNDEEISNDRILIKLAVTWNDIQAAKVLEKEGINCNLTLLFSFAQTQACVEAEVFLISLFVGRIMDWYKAKLGTDFSASEDPGGLSVTNIYNYYKEHGYKTVVMGASFRNIGEILELAGCDRLTISPQLLQALKDSEGIVETKLVDKREVKSRPIALTESQFLWEHNQDPMAVEKLAEGIRNFAIDQNKLETMIMEKL